MTLFLLASWPGLSRPSTSYLPRSKAWMPGTRPGVTGNLSERRLGLADDRLESRRLGDGEVREHLAVDHDAGLAQAGDEAAVIEPERAHRGVEALNPKRAEGALLALAVAEGILAGLLHRLLGDADGVLAPAAIALGGLEHLLVLGMRCDAALDACHGRPPVKARRTLKRYAAESRGTSAVRQKVLFDVVAVGLEQHVGAAQLADLLLGALDHAVALARLRIEDLSGPRHLEALLGARLGLDLGHLALLKAASASACRPENAHK